MLAGETNRYRIARTARIVSGQVGARARASMMNFHPAGKFSANALASRARRGRKDGDTELGGKQFLTFLRISISFVPLLHVESNLAIPPLGRILQVFPPLHRVKCVGVLRVRARARATAACPVV